jgi:hypothetical protein
VLGHFGHLRMNGGSILGGFVVVETAVLARFAKEKFKTYTQVGFGVIEILLFLLFSAYSTYTS